MINKPNINVTPLIDVLLVLLIIFMVVSPLKPTDFKAKIPQEQKKSDEANPNSHTLIVSLGADSTLKINNEVDLGTIQETGKLTQRLADIFRQRAENNVYAEGKESRIDLPEAERVEKTVFIKMPRSIDYGSVVKVVDAVKLAGASPISLQIDDLN